MAVLTVTPANVVPSASAGYLPGEVIAGETITAGQAVYVSSSPQTGGSGMTTTVMKANATGTGAVVQVIGIAAGGASAGQPIKVVIHDPLLAIGATVAAGDVVYLHPTAGGITVAYADILATHYVCVIGVGVGSNKINMGATAFAGSPIGVVRADVPK